MPEIHVLIILFLVAVESATFIPPQTDVLLLGLWATQQYRPWLLLAAAVAGSVLGGLIAYYAGRYLRVLEKKKWFPVKKKYIDKAENIFRKHGKVSLLLCGMPVIGDALTLTAGMMRVNPFWFAAGSAVSRLVRYGALWALYAGLF